MYFDQILLKILLPPSYGEEGATDLIWLMEGVTLNSWKSNKNCQIIKKINVGNENKKFPEMICSVAPLAIQFVQD